MRRVLLLATLGVTLQACCLPVLVAEEPATQTKTGVVKKVDPPAKQIVVMVAREMTFTVTEATQIVQGGQARKLTDLNAGDTVTVVYSFTPERNRVASSITIVRAGLLAAPAGVDGWVEFTLNTRDAQGTPIQQT